VSRVERTRRLGRAISASFQQVRGEAVPKHVGIHLLLNAGTAGGILAGAAWGLGIHGPTAAVPAIAGEQPELLSDHGQT
jgi:hypothetical protein